MVYQGKFGLTVDELKEMNKLTNEGLAVGMKLKTQKTKEPVETVETEVENVSVDETSEDQFIEYEVQKGDTMYSISRKFEVNAADILKWNNKADNSLSIGEKIKMKK